MKRFIFLIHVCATFFMIGLIWFVQIVHYPLLSLIGHDTFAAYEKAHIVRCFMLTAIPMAIEFLSALYLAWRPIAAIPFRYVRWNVALLVLVWLISLFVMVPIHVFLSQGFSASLIQALLITNWARTIVWSMHGLLVFWMARYMHFDEPKPKPVIAAHTPPPLL